MLFFIFCSHRHTLCAWGSNDRNAALMPGKAAFQNLLPWFTRCGSLIALLFLPCYISSESEVTVVCRWYFHRRSTKCKGSGIKFPSNREESISLAGTRCQPWPKLTGGNWSRKLFSVVFLCICSFSKNNIHFLQKPRAFGVKTNEEKKSKVLVFWTARDSSRIYDLC